MSIPGAANPLLLATAAAGGYQISRSLRFNSSDSAYLSRTPASAGNRQKWTFACWLKKGKNNISQSIFSNSTATEAFRFDSDTLYFYSDSGNNGLMTTNAVLRDPSAWYHVLLSVDTTQATAANRANIYINGVLQTLNLDTRPTQNYNTLLNSATALQIGGPTYFDGYLADIHFIDGQALTPSSFTEVSATTGQLIPKAYSGSFGTNGFWLKFSDNSAATATTLGKDYSGNSNNWTPNNLSVTAGAGNDSLVDTPTSYGTDTGAGGEVRGNYCTLNPLSVTAGTFTNGNLEYVGPSSFRRANGTTSVSSGKWYWEVTALAASRDSAYNNRYNGWGIGLSTTFNSSDLAPVDCFIYWDTGQYQNWSSTTVTANSVAANDVLGFALNLDANTITVTRNGSTVVNAVTLGVSAGTVLTPFHLSYDATYSRSAFNFGQRPWANTPPAGFKALCDTNLPAPVVAKPSTVMDVLTWTGTGGSRTFTGLGFSPDLVWGKARSVAGYNHQLFDVVRGTGSTKDLSSSLTAAEGSATTDAASYGYLSSFTSDGFGTTTGSVNNAYWNGSSTTYVAWCFDAGSNTVSNTQGSITTSVRASASSGFAVITGSTPSSTTNFSFGHNLGIAPSLVIYKHTAVSGNWHVYHRNGGGNNYNLNSTAGPANSGLWSGLDPTSTLITIPSTIISANSSAFVCYAWAPVAGYSSFGSYVGNGSADGPFVFTGMRPRWIMIKRTDVDVSSHWIIWDAARDSFNAAQSYLLPNDSLAEGTTAAVAIDFLSSGFKLRNSSTNQNTSNGTYIYAAFAESPFQYARAR